MEEKEKIQQEEILPLKQQEIDLIFALRHKYRYGRVEIMVQDGVPNDILKTVERVRLGKGDRNLFDIVP